MNIFKIEQLALALALTTCMTAHAFAAATPKEDSVITQDQITLGDVFDGVTADADHYLAPAPEPGKTITLGTYDLVRISTAFNLGWVPDANGPHVVIRHAGGEIDRYDVQAALEQKLKEEMKGQKFDMELSDRAIGFSVPETPGKTPDRSVVVEKLTYDAATNAFNAVVAAAAAPEAKKEVSGHYYLISRIPVLKTPLRPGDVISSGDIDYIDMRSTDITSSMVTETSNLVGQTPRRGVSAMKPLTAGDVRLPTIVKKGDLVTMVLKNNALSLTVQGRAMDNGSAGDAIHVMNSTSKQVLDAIVTGAQTVSVKPPLGTL
jgi:flagella basal body P-ring formation protein FlgA